MRHILLVAVSDGLKNLFGDDGGFEFTEFLSLCNLIEQFHTIAEFSYKEDTALIFIHFIESNNIRVIKVLKDIYLIFEPDTLLFSHIQLINDFHGPELASCLLLALLYSSEGTYSYV